MNPSKIKFTFDGTNSSFKCTNNGYDYVFISVTPKPLTLSLEELDKKYLDLTDSASFIYHFIFNEPVENNTAYKDVLNLVYKFVPNKLIIFNEDNYYSLPKGCRPFYEDFDEYKVLNLDLFITGVDNTPDNVVAIDAQ